jgi:hypothetical protein
MKLPFIVWFIVFIVSIIGFVYCSIKRFYLHKSLNFLGEVRKFIKCCKEIVNDKNCSVYIAKELAEFTEILTTLAIEVQPSNKSLNKLHKLINVLNSELTAPWQLPYPKQNYKDLIIFMSKFLDLYKGRYRRK